MLKNLLDFVISSANNVIEDSGLDHIVPHSHLHLAQMSLRSAQCHYEPGINTDDESIRQATNCLKVVDLSFFPTESDPYRCKGNNTLARESAKCVLRMARTVVLKQKLS